MYFVKHSYDTHRGVPGRYAFRISARSLHRSASTWFPSAFQGDVYADGYAANQPGPNVDPNVFSDLMPWHLAFCLIDKRNKKRFLAGTTSILTDVVKPGDTICFGWPISAHIVLVDTLLVAQQSRFT
ncbi:hypothetical protein [Sorangium sp. So ce1151]|uniref:hypothetical protein n=1 Tax=Sorangium sp. So ce1151 TaxID=3133332 RepID=UPI003F644E4D